MKSILRGKITAYVIVLLLVLWKNRVFFQALITKRSKKYPYKGLRLVVNSPKLSDAIFSFFTVIAENYLEFDEVLTDIYFQMNPDIVSEEPYQPSHDKEKNMIESSVLK